MTLNSEALLPCPLCNCGMMLDRFVDWEGQPLANQVIIHPSPSECPLVDIQIDATPEAIAAWNRRSPSLSGGEVVAVAWASPEALRKLAGGSPTAVEPKEFEEATTPLITLSSHQSVIAAKDAEIERLTKQRDQAQERASSWAKEEGKRQIELGAAEARANAAAEALTRIAAIKYPKADTHYALKATIDYARDQASEALSTLNGAKP